MAKVRATRHNGRTGKNGVFRAGHNDRSFDVEQADHIDPSRSYMNVYWDCYQGINYTDADGNRPERKYSFDQVELSSLEGCRLFICTWLCKSLISMSIRG